MCAQLTRELDGVMEHDTGPRVDRSNRQGIPGSWLSTVDPFMPFDPSIPMREPFHHFFRPAMPVHETSSSEEEYKVFLEQCTAFGPSSSSDDYYSSNRSLIESSVPVWAMPSLCGPRLDGPFDSLHGELPSQALDEMDILNTPMSPASEIEYNCRGPITPASSRPVSLVGSTANDFNAPFGNFQTSKLSSTFPHSAFDAVTAQSPPMSQEALSATSRGMSLALGVDPTSTGLITPDASPVKAERKTCTTSERGKRNISKTKDTTDTEPDDPAQPEAPTQENEVPESEISPELILGMTWGDINQLQMKGNWLCSLLFTSRAEATRTQHDTLRENDEDETIPITLAEKKLLVTLIIAAMKDISIAQDSTAKKSQWTAFVNKSEAAEQLEWGSWTLLVSNLPSRSDYHLSTGV